MNRRNFIKKSSVAGLAVASLTLDACTPTTKKKDASEEKQSFVDDFELDEITIDELRKKMESGEYSSRAITELYLSRIKQIDKKGPAINSVIELNPDALSIAEQMDKDRSSGLIHGPLHGIPVLIKDNIDTGDKMMTTAGSLALIGNIAGKDAFIIRQLRAAGAVLLGKTNLSEWANFRSTRSTSGWSSRGGQTRNPLVLDRNPCGSSSGSGAAVSANLCAVAIGTETDGSVIAPAAWCGIVGMKPTVGLLSRSGIIPISKTQDTAGPMARTVRDAAILLGALTGVDPDDAASLASTDRSLKDYTKYLDADSLNGKRIGIEKSFLKGHEGIVGLYLQAVDAIKNKGASIIEIELLKPMKELSDSEYTVLKYEFKDGLNRYLSNAKANVRSLADIIEFNRKNKSQAMPYFKQEILEECETKGGLDSDEYRKSLAITLRSRMIIDDLMAKHQLDAIAGISIGLPGCIDLVNGDYDTGFYFCPPAAMAGYPHITVPMGKVHELPVGFSFIAGAWNEPILFGIAFAFEQATKKREKSRFIETLIPA